MKFYNCGQLGHPTYRFPERPSSSNHNKRVAYVQEDNSNGKKLEVDHIESKMGENLVFRRVLIKKLAPNKPKHRRALFRIKCNIIGKV